MAKADSYSIEVLLKADGQDLKSSQGNLCRSREAKNLAKTLAGIHVNVFCLYRNCELICTLM